MTLTFTRSPESIRARASASAPESLTPAIRTYSAVIRRWDSSGHARMAATTSRSGWVRSIGISRARVAESVALIDTARFGRRARAAKRANPGVMPDVDTVTRRAG